MCLPDTNCSEYADSLKQFNFPDHTKVVISPDGKHCDFYHLPLEAVTYLKQNRIIPDALLEQRDVLSYSVSTLLRGHSDLVNPHAKLHVFKDLVVANCFGEKLAFVKDIVRRWYECGGLGRLGEGEEAKIKWHGRFDRFRSANPDKLVWVTVGAKGGDGPLEARVPR